MMKKKHIERWAHVLVMASFYQIIPSFKTEKKENFDFFIITLIS